MGLIIPKPKVVLVESSLRILFRLSKGFNILDPQEYKNKIFNNTILKKDMSVI